MSNKFDEIRQAINEARQTMRAAEFVANDIAIMLDGNLRSVQPWNLKKLKRQLKNFNMHTGRWNDD